MPHLGRFALGLGLMSAGFCILTLSATRPQSITALFSATDGIGLAVMGFAELFIDPVHVANYIEIPGVTGVLTGILSCCFIASAIQNYRRA